MDSESDPSLRSGRTGRVLSLARTVRTPSLTRTDRVPYLALKANGLSSGFIACELRAGLPTRTLLAVNSPNC